MECGFMGSRAQDVETKSPPRQIFLGAGLDRARVNFVEPGFQGCEQAVCGTVVETPFAFLEVEGELGPWDAIVAAQMALGLVPEVLDAVCGFPCRRTARDG